jgi:hypothetical protein
MRYRDHLDYIPLNTGGPIGIHCSTRPPCNDVITPTVLAWASLATSLVAGGTSAYMQYDSAQNAAKQAEYNAQAQADAIGEERKRQALEGQENQRRLVQEQRRQRATQLAAMAGSGAMLGTGSSLALEADTWAKQQTELADQQYVNQLSQRQLAYQRTSTLQMGQQTAAGIRSDATGQAIGNIGSTIGQAYQSWSTRPQAAGGASTIPAGYQPRTVSQRPAGL